MPDIFSIRNGGNLTFFQQVALTAKMSVPSIIAQLSTIAMQYIDAAMVGHLGASPSASVGLMNSSLWLFWGVCSTITMGFSVQVAHRIGGNDETGAREVLRQSIFACMVAGVIVALIGAVISGSLPHWLGGQPEICHDASVYFLVFVCALPMLTLNYLGSGMLRSAGNMKIPGMFNVLMCLLDVIFNFFLIFPTRDVMIVNSVVTLPGAGLGVLGAALGTVLAESICAIATMYWVCCRQTDLVLTGRYLKGRYLPSKPIMRKAVSIALPMSVEHLVFCGAQIMVTAIVAPLGMIAIAANAFAVTAESLCYMPGFGIGEAATTLCGQAYGAKRYMLVRRFAYIATLLGIVFMSVMGVWMYFGADLLMEVMSPVQSICSLGAEVLRIEVWAEPMYAASIVAYGAFVGVGDTLIPAAMNFGSIWLIRIPLAAVLAPVYGLRGVWMAMCLELTFRGIIFLIRMCRGKWLKT